LIDLIDVIDWIDFPGRALAPKAVFQFILAVVIATSA
jgi:hypothetical protein